MQQGTLEELIAFCEQRKLTELVAGLRQELKTNRKPIKDTDANEMQKRTLRIIKEALVREDRKNIKQRKPDSKPDPKVVKRPENSFNKDQNEEIMEGLLNKIVTNPAFINDDKLNSKIEKIFGVEAFQKMVDNAEVFQDISNTSIFN
jgi:hypothetical protein